MQSLTRHGTSRTRVHRRPSSSMISDWNTNCPIRLSPIRQSLFLRLIHLRRLIRNFTAIRRLGSVQFPCDYPLSHPRLNMHLRRRQLVNPLDTFSTPSILLRFTYLQHLIAMLSQNHLFLGNPECEANQRQAWRLKRRMDVSSYSTFLPLPRRPVFPVGDPESVAHGLLLSTV